MKKSGVFLRSYSLSNTHPIQFYYWGNNLSYLFKPNYINSDPRCRIFYTRIWIMPRIQYCTNKLYLNKQTWTLIWYQYFIIFFNFSMTIFCTTHGRIRTWIRFRVIHSESIPAKIIRIRSRYFEYHLVYKDFDILVGKRLDSNPDPAPTPAALPMSCYWL